MATIEKRKSSDGTVSWRVRVRKFGYPARTKTFKQKTDAATWARHLEGRLDRGNSIPDQQSTRRTIVDAIDRYISKTLPYKQRNRDQKNVIQRLKWWRDQIGDYALQHVTPAIIVEYRDLLVDEGRQPGTVNRYLVAISSVFTTAVEEWYWLEDSPMRKVRKLGEPQGRTFRTFTKLS